MINKNRFKSLYFALAGLTLGAISVFAAPDIACENKTFDFGSRKDTEGVKHTFVIENKGDEDLIISKVKPSCGCTVAKLSSKILKPGETANIETNLSLKGRRGKMNKPITVYSNDPDSPTLMLKLVGEAVSLINVSPTFLNLGSIPVGKIIEKKIKVTLNGDEPIKVTHIESLGKNTGILAELITLEEAKSYAINVKSPVDAKEGYFSDRLRIYTDNKKTPYVDVSVNGNVTGGLIVSRKNLILVEKSDTKMSRSFQIRPGSIKEFKVLEALWPSDAVESEIRNLGPSRGYHITFSNIESSKSLDGKEIIIKTDAAEYEEIKIPITVRSPITGS